MHFSRVLRIVFTARTEALAKVRTITQCILIIVPRKLLSSATHAMEEVLHNVRVRVGICGIACRGGEKLLSQRCTLNRARATHVAFRTRLQGRGEERKKEKIDSRNNARNSCCWATTLFHRPTRPFPTLLPSKFADERNADV